MGLGGSLLSRSQTGGVRGIAGDIFRRFVARIVAQQFRASCHFPASRRRQDQGWMRDSRPHVTGTDGFRWRRHSPSTVWAHLISMMMKGLRRSLTCSHEFWEDDAAKCIQSHRAKVASRETQSCLCFCVWVNTCRFSRVAVRDCLRIWTICTSSADLKGWVQCMNCFAIDCGSIRAYSSILKGFSAIAQARVHSDQCPVCPEFVKFLQNKNSEHKVLVDRIPAVQDTQSAWLLLSFCAAARSNFFLRAVRPIYTSLHRHTTKGCGSAFIGY